MTSALPRRNQPPSTATTTNQKPIKRDQPVCLKLVIRLLPPLLSKDEFLKQLGQFYPATKIDRDYYVQGHLPDNPYEKQTYSRAYILFKVDTDVQEFVLLVSGKPFFEPGSTEPFTPLIEKCLNNRIPGEHAPTEPSSIENDEAYKQFLVFLEGNGGTEYNFVEVLNKLRIEKKRSRKALRDAHKGKEEDDVSKAKQIAKKKAKKEKRKEIKRMAKSESDPSSKAKQEGKAGEEKPLKKHNKKTTTASKVENVKQDNSDDKTKKPKGKESKSDTGKVKNPAQVPATDDSLTSSKKSSKKKRSKKGGSKTTETKNESDVRSESQQNTEKSEKSEKAEVTDKESSVAPSKPLKKRQTASKVDTSNSKATGPGEAISKTRDTESTQDNALEKTPKKRKPRHRKKSDKGGTKQSEPKDQA